MKRALQIIPLLCWIFFLHWRAWDKTYGQSFMDPMNWISIIIVPGWYLLIEYGWEYLSGLLKGEKKS